MIVVLGAGIAGLMTALYLVESGHEVTIVDEAPGPAMGCSHANAGIIAVGHTEAWAGPSAPYNIVKALFGLSPAIKVSNFWDPALWRWGSTFLANCSHARHRCNSSKLLRLSQYSSTCMDQLADQTGLYLSRTSSGTLYVFRDAAQFAGRSKELTRADGFTELPVNDLLHLEPGLTASASTLCGGILSSEDSNGDCYQNSQKIAMHLTESKRATFALGEKFLSFQHTGNRISHIATQSGAIPCDAVIVALGSSSPQALTQLSIQPKIYPVKGYSATYPILNPAAAPDLPLIDETELVAIARYGNRLRITGIAEFAKGDLSVPQPRREVLDQYVRKYFPGAADLKAGTYWAGSRPTTPEGPPYLGRIRQFDNLFLNAGHGQLGWTMAAGSGQIIADLINGNTPAIRQISTKARWLEAV